MKRSFQVLCGGFAVLGAFAMGAAWVEEVQEDREQALRAAERSHLAPTDTVVMGPMPRELRESSGLGISRSYPGVFWTHNDSGDRPRFFAIDSAAAILATFDVEGARARDWEAMELGPCPVPSAAACLHLADVGDNGFSRESVTIYIVEEPDPAAGDAEVTLLGTVRFVYPDGPHDVEALAMTPNGDLIVVTKERSGTPWLFQISAEDVASAGARAQPLTLAPGRRLPIELKSWRDQTTGASLNSTGDVLAVRTYSDIYFFRWPISGEPEQAAETCFLGDLQRQGEAISFRDDDRLLLSSETTLRQGYLLTVRCVGLGT
jgi:hypothetical protein